MKRYQDRLIRFKVKAGRFIQPEEYDSISRIERIGPTRDLGLRRGFDPQGLRGQAIPLSARIVAIVDVYDALTSKRPYKEPWTHAEAVKEIVKGSGSHFDPVIVDAFLANAPRLKSIHDKLL